VAGGGPRILFLQLEFDGWRRGKHWSYAANFGVSDALRANGAACFSVTTPWLPRLPRLCGRRRFDQVWVEVFHNPLPESLLGWIADAAPVRVALICESLGYEDTELDVALSLAQRRAVVGTRLPYFTHVLTVDEADAGQLAAEGRVRALWWPQSVPARAVAAVATSLAAAPAAFIGAAYGRRVEFLQEAALRGLLAAPPPPDGPLLPRAFDLLQRAARAVVRLDLPVGGPALAAYLAATRLVRWRAFSRWLRALREHAAVVNLPHLLKTYPGRVYEGMAAGRPVVSWRVPARPRTAALFEPDREILLFDDVAGLAEALRRLRAEPALGVAIAENARRRLLAFHTAERRAAQILGWLAGRGEPRYA
jgi:hypothetical protein